MAGALAWMVIEKIGEALVSKVMEKLGDEVSSVVGAQAELEKISAAFESIQALLNDAEIMQFHNESTHVWLKRLKDVAYDVEDLLDEMISWREPESRTDDGDERQRKGKFLSWTDGDDTDNVMRIGDKVSRTDDGDDRQRKGKRKWLSWTDGDDTDNVMTIEDTVQPFVSKFKSPRDFAHQIKEVSAKLDQIAADTSKFSFQLNHSFRGGSELHKAEYQTSSLVDESKMLGRDRDKYIIISKLVSGSSSEEGGIHVISIVGVGGLGKTTLAQLICNDERVKRHFHKVLWVCVSDEFDVKTITRKVIEDAGEKAEFSEPNPLQKQLRKILERKRFLLVLDDVWNDSSAKWEKLWPSFQSGAPGSKILVTTRSKKVAITCMPSAYMHELEGLSYDDSWLLFSSRAFAGRKAEDCLALEKIGREIVNKCKGVPLSLKVIGSVMRSKRTAQDWQDILESETWEIPEIAKGILPALLLSYYNLPVHLKQCFAYCSVFPKDHVMEKDRLVNLWLAHGFIKPQGRRQMEAIGEGYFDELVALSLFQKVVSEFDYEEEEEEEEEEKEKVVGCTIHDLLHDLAQFITKNEYCIFENGKSDSSSVTARHSSFIVDWGTLQIPAPLCDAKKLRTLIQIGDSVIDTIPDNLFQCARSLRALAFSIKELPSSVGSLKHLRCLDLSYSEIVELPESVTHLRNLLTLKLTYCEELDRLPRGMGKLVSLRYLDLSNSKIVELPESVTQLRNLQTLKLNGCDYLQSLPSGMSAMVHLRHLEIKKTLALKYLPEGLGGISSLRTLSRFIVGGDGGCKIGELNRLNSLQGKLVIEDLKRVCNGDEAKEAELYKKSHLRVLSLHVLLADDDFELLGDHDVSGDDEVERMDDVLEALRPPHTNLEKLVIERCIGSKFPTWMEDLPFSNLVDLRLIGCYKCTQLSGLGRLPSLKFLQIKGGLIKRVGHEFYGNGRGGGINGVAFPKLEKLEFSFMNELEEWDLRLEDGEIMPSLQTLNVYNCPKLKALPRHLLKSLTSLRIWDYSEISGMKCLLKLRSLPDDLGQLESFRSLTICDCPELRSLPDDLS